MRDKVARIRGRLPEDVRRAGRRQAGGGRAAVLLARALGRELRPAPALRHRRPAGEERGCRRCPGVGQARIFGERRFSMRVWLVGLRAVGPRPHRAGRAAGHPEPQRRGAGRPHRVRPARVHRPLARRAQDPRGVRRAGGQQHRRRAGQAQGSGPGRAGRRGRAERAPVQGHSAVAIGVVRQSKSNIIQVADAIRQELPRIQASLPPGRQARRPRSTSRSSCQRSIREAEETLHPRRGCWW